MYWINIFLFMKSPPPAKWLVLLVPIIELLDHLFNPGLWDFRCLPKTSTINDFCSGLPKLCHYLPEKFNFLNKIFYLPILEAWSFSVELWISFFHLVALFDGNINVLRLFLVCIVQCFWLKTVKQDPVCQCHHHTILPSLIENPFEAPI